MSLFENIILFLPLNLAIDISKTDAEGAQRALMDAYTQKKLRRMRRAVQ